MRGWRVFPAEPAIRDWIDSARPAAEASVTDPAHVQWLRHGGTWFAGVDVLPNDSAGRLVRERGGSSTPSRSPRKYLENEEDRGPPLTGAALREAERVAGPLPLHPGQVSVTWPGYPERDPEETEAAHRFRRTRDAAHLDGLKPVGPDRRRMIREPHAWILGLPLSPMRAGQAPLVVWEGSQEILRDALTEALAPFPEADWPNVDVTEAYQAARRRIFATCARVEIEAQPGEAILLHRLLLHGVAPWDGPEGPPRMVIYFRPALPGGVPDWLSLP